MGGMKLIRQSQIKVSRHLSTNFKKALNELYLRLSAQLKSHLEDRHM